LLLAPFGTTLAGVDTTLTYCPHVQVLVIETATARAGTPQIMEQHSIPHAMSADLRQALPSWP
jgi:hypothetical protein